MNRMDDTISRRAAIRWVKTECNPYGKPTLDFESGKKVIEHLERMPSAQPEQRWIPCSERMPEEKDAGILKKFGTSKRSDYVLATVEVKTERMTVTACTYDGVWDWKMKYAFPDYEVAAWMPLPEPYKAKSEEV